MLLVSDSSSLYSKSLGCCLFKLLNWRELCERVSESFQVACLLLFGLLCTSKWCRCCRVFSMRKRKYLKVAIRHVIMSHKNSSDRTISIFTYFCSHENTLTLHFLWVFTFLYSIFLSLSLYLVSVVSDKTLISHNSSASGGPNDSKTSKFNQGEWWNACARPGISH